MRKISHEHYLSQIRYSGITPLVKYINTSTKILHRCDKCFNEWMVKPDNVKAGYGCPKCYSKNRVTSEDKYKADIKGSCFTLSGEFTNMNTKVLHQCVNCKSFSTPKPAAVKRGSGCKHCAKNNLKLTKVEFQQSISKSGSILIGDYNGSVTKTLFKCERCSHEWMTKPSSIRNRKTGCPKCAEESRKSPVYSDIPTYFYYIKIEKSQYKVGVCFERGMGITQALKRRYSPEYRDGVNIELLDYKLFENGEDAITLEQSVVFNSDIKHIDKSKMILKSGYTETFEIDVSDHFTIKKKGD